MKISLLKFIPTYFSRDIIVIFLLGISAGAPLAFLLSTLKIILMDGGISLATIGFFSLISIPYSVKFLWAPFIDCTPIPFLSKKLGQRRSWMLISQIMLFSILFFVGFLSPKENMSLIVVYALSMSFISATQDIVIDAYRIETIKNENQGIASGMYIYGYRIGMLITGALALYLSSLFNWDLVCMMISGTIVIGIFATLIAKKTIKHQIFDKGANIKTIIKQTVMQPLLDFSKKSKWLLILVFIISFKLCDAFAGTMTIPFLLEIGFDKAQLATIVKTFGLFATLFGIFTGGLIIKYLGTFKSLWLGCILQALSNLAFYVQETQGTNEYLLYLVIFTENFSGGIGDVILVVYLSSLCNKTFAATQYAILGSLASIGRSLLSAPSGIVATEFGWSLFFISSVAIAIPSLIFLFFIQRSKIKNAH